MASLSTAEITESIQEILGGFETEPNRLTAWMRIRRAIGLYLRSQVGNDYFVRVYATRADRLSSTIRLRIVVNGELIELVLSDAEPESEPDAPESGDEGAPTGDEGDGAPPEDGGGA